MKEKNQITVEEICVHYSIETSFVYELGDRGLIQLKSSGKERVVAFEQLNDLERFMRMYYDLEINMEGLEAIKHLLSRVKNLQNEIKRLQNNREELI